MPVSIDPLAPCLGSPAEANLTTRAFYSKLLLHRSVRYTRCIDSNLESGRYISRVGWASRFLSLTVLRYRGTLFLYPLERET